MSGYIRKVQETCKIRWLMYCKSTICKSGQFKFDYRLNTLDDIYIKCCSDNYIDIHATIIHRRGLIGYGCVCAKRGCLSVSLDNPPFQDVVLLVFCNPLVSRHSCFRQSFVIQSNNVSSPSHTGVYYFGQPDKPQLNICILSPFHSGMLFRIISSCPDTGPL